ncbi:hypothetical protein [Simiduia aestuariiviva]|uniref:Lipoprotein n=1 Tax=Simiduia aestuariiviva TaxID=1510459 RepID=A0A839UH06_9GAMM|nr:hypothetical protein [Simiduia aestuariiviva]MBB3167324.1 hypothetical protein [Simiduia aestuariiviva]
MAAVLRSVGAGMLGAAGCVTLSQLLASAALPISDSAVVARVIETAFVIGAVKRMAITSLVNP